MEDTMHICPICYGTELVEFNSRPKARCTQCSSFERGRLGWMTLTRLGLLRRGIRLLNLAPETFMLKVGKRIIGRTYVPADYCPENFPERWGKIERLDLCAEAFPFEPASFDAIYHNHVLEHVHCSVPGVIAKLNDLLVPGGWHIFSVPISPGRKNEENYSPELTDAERKQRFGQIDHVRVFGSDYMEAFQDGGLTQPLFDVRSLFTKEELEIWGVPTDVLDRPCGHTVFAWRKARKPGT
jgi:SAM-dependent methyltransferase